MNKELPPQSKNHESQKRHRLKLKKERRRVIWHNFAVYLAQEENPTSEGRDEYVREALQQTRFAIPVRRNIGAEYQKFGRAYEDVTGIKVPLLDIVKLPEPIAQLRERKRKYRGLLTDLVAKFLTAQGKNAYNNADMYAFVGKACEDMGLPTPTESAVHKALVRYKVEYKKETGRTLRRRVKRRKPHDPTS